MANWKVFWVQPEIGGAIVTPSQREPMPVFKSMLSVQMKEREHSHWQFGHPVTFSDKPKGTTPPKLAAQGLLLSTSDQVASRRPTRV